LIAAGLLALLLVSAPQQEQQAPPSAPAQPPTETKPQATPSAPAAQPPADSKQQEPAEAKAPVRKAPAAKSAEEFEAYRSAAMQPDLIAAEKLATDFASRFPDSELRESLYQTLMLKQQNGNNAEGALADAERVLLLNPQNRVALVVAANVLSERTQPTSADAEQRFEQGMRYAERALQGIEANGVPAAPETSTDDVAAFRATLTSIAHAAEGNIELLRKNYMEAEKHFQAAAAAKPDPDALVLYRLALAQHGLKRLDDALANVNKAMAAVGASRDLILQERIKQERSTLIKAGAKS
jgi:tetratricopeptide (TPR) repeat protein